MQLPFTAKFHKTCAMFAAAAVLFGLTARCFADPVTLSSSAVSSIPLAPSSDSISLNAGTVTSDDSDPGSIIFQTGDFLIGDSGTTDQIIPFLFQDTLTLNGIAEVLDIAGQDDVTTTADTLSIFAGAPIVFGGDFFTLQPFSTTATAVGQDLPIELQGSVTPTNEPSSLLLISAGAFAAMLLAAVSRRSLVESIPDMPALAAAMRAPTWSRSWVRRGASFHPAAPDGGRSPLEPSFDAGSAGRRAGEDFQAD